MGGCNVVAILSMADVVCLVCCRNVECTRSAATVWYACWSLSYVCCKILLLLNKADMGCLTCGRLWSKQCSVPCSFSAYE